MKNTKKILSLVLCCLMLLSFACSAASYSDVPADHVRYQAIDMLSSMDIITGFPDGSFKPDEAVTRAQMAALITRMFNLSSSAVTAQPFSDVALDYWAAANIVAAKNMNIINGFPDGTFQPEASVTYEQAVKMIVCALNYGTAAEAMGGYPAGYIQQASKLNILKNAVHPNTDPSPRGIIAQLLYNSLDVEMLVPQVNADGTVDYVKQAGGGNTINQQIQKTQKLSNVTVVRTPRVNLEPGVAEIQSVNDNAMFVKTSAGKYVKVIVSSAEDFAFIGQNVDITYKEDTKVSDDKTLTNINRNTGVRAYENIKLSHVVSLTASGMTYYTDIENEKTTNITFNGSAPTVLYNERLHQNGITALNDDLFNVTNHTYTTGVISVYVGGNSTLVKAKSYKTYVTDSSYDATNETIKLKGGMVGGVEQNTITMTIPTKDTYINETIIKKGTFDYATGAVANATTQSSISKGSLISIAYNNQDTTSTYYEVLVSTTTLSGGITERTTDDETRQPLIKIGSSTKSYVMSKDLARYELTNVLTDDSTAKFYIDAFDRIGYFDNHKAGDTRLGIPVSVATGGSGLEKETQLKIYNVSTGNVETLLFKDEVSGDSRVAALKDNSGRLIKDAIFKYTIKSSKIDTLEALQAGTVDYTYVAANSTTAEVSDIVKNSNKITFENGKSITYRSGTDKIIMIGSIYATDEVTPKTASMNNNAAYTGRVYQLNNKVNGTTGNNMQYIIIRPMEQLLTTSPTYIVESRGSGTTLNGTSVVTLNVYPFFGSSAAGTSGETTELVFAENVLNSLQLQTGDMFSYYEIPTTSGIDIENLRNVYIFARARDIAIGNYPANGFMASSDNAKDANVYNNDYRYWGIRSGQSALQTTYTNYSYAYYMGIPMEYSGEGESVLKMAIDPANQKLPILPGDTTYLTDVTTPDANGLYKYADGSYFNEYNIESLANIIVYDANETEANKFKKITGADQVKNYLEQLNTVAGNLNSAQKRYDTIVLKGYHNTESVFNLFEMYIIKDARANP